MRAFVQVGAHYVASLDEVERTILAGVVADTALLLGAVLDDEQDAAPEEARAGPGGADPVLRGLEWTPTEADAPADPAVARLLPPASRDDADVAREFRRLTESDLREGKVANLRRVWTVLRAPAGPLAVARAEAGGWAAALTDVRLVLATRLGIETDEDAGRLYAEAARRRTRAGKLGRRGRGKGGGESVEDEVHAALVSLYAALTWLQESLVTVMLADAGHGAG